VHDPHASITSNLCRESGGVEMMGLEPTTPACKARSGGIVTTGNSDRYTSRPS
jgi:hypothetical protein